MKKRALLAIIALASTAATAYALNLLDQLVHGTLYNYGLQFSYDWANPYWFLLRIIQVLLVVGIGTAIVSLAFTLRPFLKTEKLHVRTASIPRATRNAHVATRNVEKARPTSATSPELSQSTTTFPRQRARQVPTSAPTPTHQPSTKPTSVVPSPSYTSSNANGFITCQKCGKSFSQPLRILDFQGERPHLVDTCPFCSETIRSAPQVEGKAQDRDRQSQAQEGSNNTPKTIRQYSD